LESYTQTLKENLTLTSLRNIKFSIRQRGQKEINAANLQPIDKLMLARQKQKPLEVGELVTYDNSKAAKKVLPQRRGPVRVIEVDKGSITL
jgi:hypothetical protein